MKTIYSFVENVHLILITFLLLLIQFQFANAQESTRINGKSYVTAGFGVMEVLNLGIDFELNNSQIGCKIGGIAADGERLFSLTADYSYYFAGNSKITQSRSWFGKVGIQYFSDNADTFSEKATGIIARFGKKFYFSEKAGVKCDVGMFFRIHHREYYERPPFINFDMPIIPGLGISFFYQI